jgi:hypothetical protein
MRYFSSKSLLNFIFFACAFSLALSVNAQQFSFVGKATDIETGALLYSEEHAISLDSEGEYLSSEVRYVAADGSLIASKRLDFEASQTAPTLDFQYQNATLRYGSEYREGMFVLKTDRSEMLKEDRISLKNDASFVVDGGFDRLLVKRWDSLLSGDEHEFDFLAITRGSTIEFELSVVAQTSERVRFQIKPSSWVIGLLVDPIFLEYDRESRLLMRYEGLTNIALSDGDGNAVAVIQYFYDEKARFLALKRIEAASAS